MSLAMPAEAVQTAVRSAPASEPGAVVSYRDLRGLRSLSNPELRLVRGGRGLKPRDTSEDSARLLETIRGMDSTGVMAMDMWAIGTDEMYATFSLFQ